MKKTLDIAIYKPKQIIFVVSDNEQWWHFESEKEACLKAIDFAITAPRIVKVERYIVDDAGFLSSGVEICQANSWTNENKLKVLLRFSQVE